MRLASLVALASLIALTSLVADAATGILKQVSKVKLLKSTVTRHFNDGGVKAEELFRKVGES